MWAIQIFIRKGIPALGTTGGIQATRETTQMTGQPRYRNEALRLFTEEEREQVVKLYQDNEMSMSNIAAQMNANDTLSTAMTRNHVSRILEMAHVPTRARRRSQSKRSTEPIPGIDREYAGGASMLDLAKKYNRFPETIREILVAMGVTIRPRGKSKRMPDGDELRRLIK
jgi:transposase-like protein